MNYDLNHFGMEEDFFIAVYTDVEEDTMHIIRIPKEDLWGSLPSDNLEQAYEVLMGEEGN